MGTVTRSQVGQILDHIRGTRHIAAPLTEYHDAAKARDAAKKIKSRSPEAKLTLVRKALKQYRVKVRLVADRIVIRNLDNDKELTL